MSPTIKRRVKKILLWTEITFILVMGAGMGVVLGAFYQMNKLLPAGSALDQYRAPVGTKIWSSDGYLLAKLAAENREPIPLGQVSKDMQDAIIAIEDARFYQHSGLDYRGVARAVFTNVQRGELSQGFSTITQQLARNMYLSQRKIISRKVKEILLAIQIERNWTKRQILEAYLNQVFFGSGAYGIRSAAQVYFGKAPKDLTLAESAMLAGLVQRPSDFSPYASYAQEGNYDRTLARRNAVLNRMRELKFITDAEYKKAKDTPIKVSKTRPRTIGFFRAKYFAQHVVDELRTRLNYDEDLLNKAGLTVVTTLNWKMQKEAEKIAREQVRKYRRSRGVSDAALVCIDPHNGYIRAMVGGVNEPWEKYQFNCATQAKRQPGSAFKLFVYTAAMEAGDTPGTGVNPNAAVPMPDGTVYPPKNHGGSRGYTNYTSAFAASLNGAAVNVAVKRGTFAGPRKIKEVAQRMGLKGDMRAYPALALGTSEVTVLEMAAANGVFPAKGKLAEPMAVLQVRSQEGEVLEDLQPKIVDTGLKSSTIEKMNVLTRAVVTSGTGRMASAVPDAHGKTGTTEEYTNGWFCGYTPDLACAVWTGNRDNSPMARVYGATVALPIWTEFMKKAVVVNPAKKRKPLSKKVVKRERPKRVPRPVISTAPLSADGTDRNTVKVTICPESGMLARDGCPGASTEEYMLGEQPLNRCDLDHKRQPAPKAETKEEGEETPAEPAGTGQ